METARFEARKREHIQSALKPAHQAEGLAGLESVRLVHEALPELNFDEITLKSNCLGRSLETPFFVSGMTAGHADAPAINRTIARVAQARGWAMGVGSQRRDLEQVAANGKLDRWSEFRKEFPDLFLFANLGLAQVIQAPTEAVLRLVRELRADALAVHANGLQEAIQPEGTPNFKGAVDSLRRLCLELDVPIILKETGCGFSAATLRRLREVSIAALDVSGLGGTHWGRIEGDRAAQAGESARASAAAVFANWGVSTVQTVRDAAAILPENMEIWGSGGVRTGLDAAKLVALGAHRIGFAQPVLKAALEGEATLRQWMETREFELKVALFCTGCLDPEELRRKEDVWAINSIS